ncbi:hypothetical protein ACETK8_02565 [Brevundimonas staleyi]|uniref:Uncharacterized protein n=1 Tax=Brevundimonas staleyi TaxID=74326 RepID=A0ABW0FT19_9CAUL
MRPEPDPGPADPSTEARRPPVPPALLASLSALDLTSADGRAGLQSFLAEIERRAPGALLQQAAEVQLRRLGCGGFVDHRNRG